MSSSKKILKKIIPECVYIKSFENIDIDETNKNQISFQFKIRNDYFQHMKFSMVLNQLFYGIVKIKLYPIENPNYYFLYEMNNNPSIYSTIHQIDFLIENNYFHLFKNRKYSNIEFNDFHIPKHSKKNKINYHYHQIKMEVIFESNPNKNIDTNNTENNTSSYLISEPSINYSDVFKTFSFKILNCQLEVYENENILYNHSQPLKIEMYWDLYKSILHTKSFNIFQIGFYNDYDYWLQHGKNGEQNNQYKTNIFVQNVTSGDRPFYLP
jgi:hypothetical protein